MLTRDDIEGCLFVLSKTMPKHDDKFARVQKELCETALVYIELYGRLKGALPPPGIIPCVRRTEMGDVCGVSYICWACRENTSIETARNLTPAQIEKEMFGDR